jgi:hypothetical protein
MFSEGRKRTLGSVENRGKIGARLAESVLFMLR